MNFIVKQKLNETYDCVISVDPSFRNPLATVELKAGQVIRPKYVRSRTLEWKSDRIQKQ